MVSFQFGDVHRSHQRSSAETTMPKSQRPPVIIAGCRVDQFAVRDRSVRFKGHGLLFNEGKEVGPVPRLALGRATDNTVVLFHCDARWNVVGAMGYDNVREAKQSAERFYPGISNRWARTEYTRRQANRILQQSGAQLRCSICKKLWHAVKQMVEIEKPRMALCDGCIRRLFGMIASDGTDSAA